MEKDVWEYLCGFDQAIRILSIVVFTLAALTIMSYPTLEPGSAAHTIALVNVAYLTVLGIVIAVFYVKCDMGNGPSSRAP